MRDLDTAVEPENQHRKHNAFLISVNGTTCVCAVMLFGICHVNDVVLNVYCVTEGCVLIAVIPSCGNISI